MNFFRKKNKIIGVIDIMGTITAGSKIKNHYDHYDVLTDLVDAMNDKSIQGVLLRVNSPGGTAGASWELYKTIERLSKKKPVYASISDSCCSGAYLAVSPCMQIYASLMANVGSIGVFMAIPNIQDLAEKIGIKQRTIKSGQFKDIGNPFRELTEEEVEYIQEQVDQDYMNFVNTVAKHRPQIMDKHEEEVLDGRFFTASLAAEWGFVDVLDTSQQALEDLARITGTDPEETYYYGEPTGIIDKILSKLGGSFEINLSAFDTFKG